MSILEQIKANSISELNLSQDADEVSENTGDIIEALQSNTSIVSIRFEKEFLGDMRNNCRRVISPKSFVFLHNIDSNNQR